MGKRQRLNMTANGGSLSFRSLGVGKSFLERSLVIRHWSLVSEVSMVSKLRRLNWVVVSHDAAASPGNE
jgi:hypothetical protein